MSARVFLDTNIFVYAAGQEGGRKETIANQVIEAAITGGTGVVSYQVVQEFFNVALKKFATPFTVDQAQRFLSIAFRPMFTVQPSPGLFSEALAIYSRYRTSWYDALIVAAAAESNCSVLCTEDMNHGMRMGSVRIEDPFRSH